MDLIETGAGNRWNQTLPSLLLCLLVVVLSEEEEDDEEDEEEEDNDNDKQQMESEFRPSHHFIMSPPTRGALINSTSSISQFGLGEDSKGSLYE